MTQKKPKIVIDSGIPFIRGRLDKVACTVYCPGDEISPEIISDADALIVRTRTHCVPSLLKDSAIRLITTATIGTDHIDIEWCEANGITVCSAPGCNAPGVAQYVISSLLNSGFNPAEQTLGIIGYGNVGSKVARWARDLGIRTLICDPPRKEVGLNDEIYRDMEEVLKNSHAVTLHVPLTRNGKHPTLGLIGDRELDLMKEGSILINTSRGGVVDEKSWKKHLKAKKGKAIIDVWEKEPKIDLELLSLASIATPHIAGYSHEGKIRATRMSIENIENFFGIKADKEGLYLSHSKEETKLTPALILDSYDPGKDSGNLKKNPQDFEKIRNGYNYRHEPGF